MNLSVNYLELCPSVEKYNVYYRINLNRYVIKEFLDVFDEALVLIELVHQFAVRCVKSQLVDDGGLSRLLPAALRFNCRIDIHKLEQLYGLVFLEQNGGTVQVYSNIASDGTTNLVCSITVLKTKIVCDSQGI